VKSFLGFICWALVGSLTMGSLVGVGLMLFINSHPASEGSGLEAFVALLAVVFFAAVGFLLGGIYGVVRARKIPLLPVIGWALNGALLAGILTPLVSIWITRWWSNGQVLLRSVCGAMLGFVLGSSYGIIRARRQIAIPRSPDHTA
jgi:hypothetical protein